MSFHVKQGITFCMLTNLNLSFKESWWGWISNHYCTHFKAMVVYTKETNHCEPWNIPERAPCRVPSFCHISEETFKVSFFILYFYFWNGPLEDRRIARWFCLHKHQLQWGGRRRYSVGLLRRLTYLLRAYG